MAEGNTTNTKKTTVTSWKLSKKALWFCLFAGIAICVIGFIFTYMYAQNQPKGEGLQAEIYVNDELTMTIPLETDTSTIAQVTGAPGISYQHVISGNIRIVSNDCEEKTCLETGWINELGQSITCPEKNLVMKIVPLQTKVTE